MKKLLAVAAAGAVMAAGVGMNGALAQQQLQEIIVHAGPLVTKSIVGRATGTGAPIERVSVDHYVSYADLDLIKHADVQTLNKRVQAAARLGCQQLDNLYPNQPSNLQACMHDAMQGASQQVEGAISAAQSRGDSH